MNLTNSDKFFFGTMAAYVVIGLPNIWFEWIDPSIVTVVWILVLALGALYFRLLCDRK